MPKLDYMGRAFLVVQVTGLDSSGEDAPGWCAGGISSDGGSDGDVRMKETGE